MTKILTKHSSGFYEYLWSWSRNVPQFCNACLTSKSALKLKRHSGSNLYDTCKLLGKNLMEN